MTRYVRGCDYGSVDGNPAPDFQALHAAGYRVVGLRVAFFSGGHIIGDDCFGRDAPSARAAGLAIIPYYFPSFRVGAPSPSDQVAAAVKFATGIVPHVDLPLCLDIEWGNGGIASTGHTPAEVFALVMAHLHELVKRLGCASAYTSQNEWFDLRFPNDPLLADVLLWVKTAYRLGAHQPVDTVVPPDAHFGDADWDPRDFHRIPDPWRNDGCWLEQIQGDAMPLPGNIRQADVNRFRIASAGDTGPHVRGLQRRLGIAQTGTFDAATDAAVKKFQAARGLVVDGEVGPKTIAALWWPA
ncbi:MAG TPA: peptidoglycan-binding protein [Kofleriaceae bacterium]|nr:peptidoglycan-binding protein [Kofleriaceae bacterium]